MRRSLRWFGRRLAGGWADSADGGLPPDFDLVARELFRKVEPFTMSSPERVFALRQGIQYLVRHGIPGDIVECGVWKGGSMMAAACTLIELEATDRTLWLFDTFEGMPEPTVHDVDFMGQPAAAVLASANKDTSTVWAVCAMAEVQRNLSGTGYPPERIRLVKGRVEETIPRDAPERIALLRLDTDWYASTYHEMTFLYPRLSAGGVLIVDDYGHWAGARKAVDQYFEEQRSKVLLHRIDYTGRSCVKPA